MVCHDRGGGRCGRDCAGIQLQCAGFRVQGLGEVLTGSSMCGGLGARDGQLSVLHGLDTAWGPENLYMFFVFHFITSAEEPRGLDPVHIIKTLRNPGNRIWSQGTGSESRALG